MTTRSPRTIQRLALVPWLLLVASCGPSGLRCEQDVDCAPLEDGDRCNGTLACVAGSCALAPDSVVVCATDADGPCSHNVCAPESGTCAVTPRHEGRLCDDGDPCTPGDRCVGGSCKAGSGDVCGCHSDTDCADDGDLCNGVPTCDQSRFPYACRVAPATVVTCADDGDPCTVATCVAETGACAQTPAADGVACDDGDPCTEADRCTAGACGSPHNTCSCVKDADCPDPDGDPCTGVQRCDPSARGGKGACEPDPATVVVCDSGNDSACLQNLCSPALGLCRPTAVHEGKACDDGESCTVGETCIGGTCGGGTNGCACKADSDCPDDGDLCNGLPFCNLATGACETNEATVVTCSSTADTVCAKTACVPATGACTTLPRAQVKAGACEVVDLGGGVKGSACVWLPTAATQTGPFACDDGDACTQGDACQGTTCKPGKVVCACAKDADCPDDGDACNGLPACDVTTGTCVANPASVVVCDKGQDSDCLVNTCDKTTGGCHYQPTGAGKTCSDGDACTQGETCTAEGSCAGGKAATCDDGKACTVDNCDPAEGCVFEPVVCDDGNDCTVEACDKAKGTCSQGLVTAGTSCAGDGSGCTVGDACDGKGACVTGKVVVCPDTTGPCQTTVCQSKGADGHTCVVVAAADKTPCVSGDACFTDAACVAGTCVSGTTSAVYGYAPDVAGLPSFQAGVLLGPAAKTHAGFAVLAGRSKAGGEAARWRIHVVNQAGKPTWSGVVDAPAGFPEMGEVATVLDRGADGALVVGNVRASGVQNVTAMISVSATGKLGSLALLKTPQGTQSLRARRAALHPSGGVALLTVFDKSKQVFTVKAALDGTMQWSAQLPYPFVGAGQLAVSAKGDVFIAGSIDVQGKSYFKAGYSPQGKLLWEFGRTSAVTSNRVHALDLDDEGQLVAVHRVVDGAKADFEFGVTEPATGSVVGGGRRMEEVPNASVFERVGKRFRFAGRDNAGVAFVGETDALFNASWRRGLSDNATVAGMSVSGDRTLVYGAKGGAPWARVVDRWGFETCIARGKCAGLSADACGDGDGCTADGCDPQSGCVHSPQGHHACDPGLPCTDEGRCTTGACVPKQYGRVGAVGELLASGGAFIGTVPRTGSHVGYVFMFPAQSGQPRGIKLADFDYDGMKTTNVGHGQVPALAAPAACTAATDGGVLLVGEVADAKPGRVQLVRMPANLGLAKVTVLADAACASCSLRAPVVAAAAQGAALVGANSEHQGGSGVVTHVSATGAVVWQRKLKPAGATFAVKGLAARPVGGVTAVGVQSSGNVNYPSATVIQPNNAGAASYVDTQSPGGAFLAVTGRLDGTSVAVGQERLGSMDSRLLVAIDPAGKPVWRSVATLADGLRLNSVVTLPDQGLVTAGAQTLATKSWLALQRWDAKGTLLWSRTHLADLTTILGLELPVQAVAHSLEWHGAAGVTVAGTFGPVFGLDMFGVFRGDMSGHMGCLDAGGCAALAEDACDDANPCTTDWCDPKSGCSHSPVVDGMTCGSGKVCKAGACSP